MVIIEIGDMKIKSRDNASTILLVLITLIWGATFAVIKDVLIFIGPVHLIFYRFCIATLVVFLIFVDKIIADRGRALLPGLVIGLIIFIGFLTQTYGLKFTSANKSAFITSMYVIIVPFISLFLEKKRITHWDIIGTIMALAGLYLLTRPEDSHINLGDILTLSCSLAFGFQIVLTNIWTRTYNGEVVLFYELFTTALLSSIILFSEDQAPLVINRRIILSVLYIAILATAFNIYIQNRFQKNVTSVKAAIIYTIEPVFAAIFAYILIGEIFTRTAFFGAALIIIGLVISEITRR